jgi:hypothetical protein
MQPGTGSALPPSRRLSTQVRGEAGTPVPPRRAAHRGRTQPSALTTSSIASSSQAPHAMMSCGSSPNSSRLRGQTLSMALATGAWRAAGTGECRVERMHHAPGVCVRLAFRVCPGCTCCYALWLLAGPREVEVASAAMAALAAQHASATKASSLADAAAKAAAHLWECLGHCYLAGRAAAQTISGPIMPMPIAQSGVLRCMRAAAVPEPSHICCPPCWPRLTMALAA